MKLLNVQNAVYIKLMTYLKKMTMETTKQKFTIEIERPTMDCKVTEGELYEIIGTGLHCFGWDIKITEEQ